MPPALLERVDEVLLERDEVPRVADLLVERSRGLEHEQPFVRPDVDEVEVVARDADQVADRDSGSGQANRSTMSAWPSAAKPSRSSVAISRMRGSISAERFGVNDVFTNPRIRSCSGGSQAVMIGISG